MMFAEALRFLNDRIDFEKMRNFSAGAMGGRLDRLRGWLEFREHPEKRYRTIHVAGTKGKGSSCAMLESILREAGYRVGRFTSPHLYSVLERFLVDGESCGESDFATLMFFLRDRLEEYDPSLLSEMTYFELTTMFAFEFFAQKRVDVAILEVGMGGRLDTTNLCSPCLTVIPSIGLDHMEQLGSTLTEIAAEKGGIIKPGVPLVSSERGNEAQNVLREIARSQNAPAFFLDDAFRILSDGDSFRFETLNNAFPETLALDGLSTALPGRHQQRNAASIVASALLLRKDEDLNLTEQTIRTGLRKAYVPIRVEILRPDPEGPIFIVDGAHNHSSIEAFVRTVRERFPNHRRSLLFGTSRDKDVEPMFDELLPCFDRIVLTQHSSSPRRFPARELETILRASAGLSGVEIEVEEDSRSALKTLWDAANPDDVVCATGSMYLAAELRAFFSDRMR